MRKQPEQKTHSLTHCFTQHPDTGHEMALVLVLVMLTAWAGVAEDLSGKMFTFPTETDTAHVKLTMSEQDLGAVTVCFRFFTDLRRSHTLFSLAVPSFDNAFLIYSYANKLSISANNADAYFNEYVSKVNTWCSVCATWDSVSGLGQLWLDGKPTYRKFISSGSSINGPIIIVLGQEQDSYGGGFDAKQSFVGMMSDLHMWDYTLSACDIQDYVEDLNFSPGNVLDWSSLSFQIIGYVVIEDKPKTV